MKKSKIESAEVVSIFAERLERGQQFWSGDLASLGDIEGEIREWYEDGHLEREYRRGGIDFRESFRHGSLFYREFEVDGFFCKQYESGSFEVTHYERESDLFFWEVRRIFTSDSENRPTHINRLRLDIRGRMHDLVMEFYNKKGELRARLDTSVS